MGLSSNKCMSQLSLHTSKPDSVNYLPYEIGKASKTEVTNKYSL